MNLQELQDVVVGILWIKEREINYEVTIRTVYVRPPPRHQAPREKIRPPAIARYGMRRVRGIFGGEVGGR